jgi:hypothetical protein
MSVFEADALLTQHYNDYKDQWEKTRLICYYSAAPHIKIKMSDIVNFTWDKEEIEEISPQEVEKRKSDLLSFVQDKGKVLKEFNPLQS